MLDDEGTYASFRPALQTENGSRTDSLWTRQKRDLKTMREMQEDLEKAFLGSMPNRAEKGNAEPRALSISLCGKKSKGVFIKSGD